jgi:hypothetical protein
MKCARLSGKTPKSPSGKPCNEVWPGGTALRRIWAPSAAHIESTLRISGCGYCISQGDTYEEAVENNVGLTFFAPVGKLTLALLISTLACPSQVRREQRHVGIRASNRAPVHPESSITASTHYDTLSGCAGG